MHTLAEYLSTHSIKQADFAARLGLTQATVSRLARGVSSPSLDLAFHIERATGGAVPVAVWAPKSGARASDEADHQKGAA